MFCKYCGGALPDTAKFCKHCGAALSEPSVQVGAGSADRAPVTPGTSAYGTLPVAEPSMGWFKFIINFQLFASALLNVVSAIPFITGSQYNGAADIVYATWPGVRYIDLFYVIASFAIAAYAIFVRFQLAGFRQKAPLMYYVFCVAATVISIAYLLMIHFETGFPISDLIESGARLGSSVASSIALLVINKVYFDKRSYMFVN